MIISTWEELPIGSKIDTGKILFGHSGETFLAKDYPFRVIRTATREEFRDQSLSNYNLEVNDHPYWNDPYMKYYEISND